MKKYIPLVLLAILIAAWAVFLDKTADFFVFGAPQQIFSFQSSFTEVNFPSKERKEWINALYAPAQKGKPTFLVFHGNKHNIYTFQDYMTPYLNAGYGVLLFDYRGYGKSDGVSSEKHMFEDGLSAVHFLMSTKLISPEDIILWGISLGAAPALHTAVAQPDYRFRGIILQSPFTNTTDMAYMTLAHKYEYSAFMPVLSVLLKPFLWDKNFDSVALIKEINVPILIGSSQADTVVSSTLSNVVAAHAPIGTKNFVSEVGGHDDPEWFKPAVFSFVKNLEVTHNAQHTDAK
jgi:hypothetical protein